MGADWRDSQIRYLAHFDDGGSGMRYRAEPLTVGEELTDGAGDELLSQHRPLPNRDEPQPRTRSRQGIACEKL